MNPVTHLQTTKPSYIREILRVVSEGDIISLAGGLPCPERFPMAIIEELMPRITRDKTSFQYASTAGYRPLIDDLYTRYAIPDSHEIIITNGSQQGIDLCARVFINKGDKLLVENPSYLGALQIFSIAQAQALTVTQENDGPNLAQLEVHFARGDIRFFYGIPDFNNPTGCCWSLEKRRQVAELCVRYSVLFIEDAPYRNMRFTGEPLPTVSSFAPDHCIMLRSFSKMICPALRIAALITPKRWFSAFNTLKQATDLHTTVPMQRLAQGILQHPDFAAHLERTNQHYHLRYQALYQSLLDLPHDRFTIKPVEGGMFVWLGLPTCDTLALATEALKNGVAVVPSSEFYVEDGNHHTLPSALRLNFSYNSSEKIRQGVERLMPLLEKYCMG
jgi:2-aminoadipate transaminase